MTQETKTIEIPIYRDSDGKPICFGKQSKLCMCLFLSPNRPYCDITKEPVTVDTGAWVFRPHQNCPLWQGEVQ